jgi:hypothetical protein
VQKTTECKVNRGKQTQDHITDYATQHKLNAFHCDQDTGVQKWLADLLAAIEQLPGTAHPDEAQPLQAEARRIQDGGPRGPQLLGDILPIVLARLGVGAVQSTESGERTTM